MQEQERTQDAPKDAPGSADVIVAGAGIVGLSLAWRLQEAGLATVVLERGRAGGGTSSATFAWVNATSKSDDADYHRLNAAGLRAYEALAAEAGAETIGLFGRGSLQWARRSETEPHARLLGDRHRLLALDYPVEWLDRRAMRASFPALESLAEDAEGLWATADRWLEVDRYLAWVTARFRALGGRLLSGTALTAIERNSAGGFRAAVTSAGKLAARHLVVAAGPASGALLVQLSGGAIAAEKFPLRSMPGLLVETPPTPIAARLDAVFWSPDPKGFHLRPTAAGGLLLGADDLDELAGDGSDADAVQQAKQELLARACGWLPRLPRLELATELGWRIGHRPMPQDGRPIVGPLAALPGVHLVVTHSGVTLAPELARLLAEWLATARQPTALQPYAPGRFGL
jgi:glycine/D-amino acid oxidase-like deaminating enzyme